MDLLQKRLLSRKEASRYVGLGLNRGVEFCNKSGARIQVGHRAMYDKQKLDQYIDSLTTQNKTAKTQSEDSLKIFINKFCTITYNDNDRMRVLDFYKQYKAWCLRSGNSVLSKKEVKRLMIETHKIQFSDCCTIGTKRNLYGYVGITLKEE